jgi:hypothetical protein
MPISIAGSGTITGISVGGIPDGVVDTDVLAANAVTFGKIGTTEQGQLCKAWVNFNGTGAVAIRASYNVSSITDNGTGDYTVNFTTALADANYSAVATSSYTDAGATYGMRMSIGDGNSATYGGVASGSCRMVNRNEAGVFRDPAAVHVAIFR